MYEQLKYINHINEELEFGKDGIFVNENELHDYNWEFSSDNNIVSNFSRGVVKSTLPVIIASKGDEGVKQINNLMEIAEKDVLANKAGRFVIGDYYYKAFITGSKKKKYSSMRGFIHADLSIVSDYPAWIKESNSSFVVGGGGEGGKNLDYAFDFPYDFTSPNTSKTLINTNFTESDFKIKIYGEVDNPSVVIGGQTYKVNCKVNNGEYLTIDSKEKTVYLTQNNGTVINHFKDRDKDNYIFKKLPSGESSVSWNGLFNFDVTLYEERSEPKWT